MSLQQAMVAAAAATPKENIKKLFEKVQVSASAYDTAWVAMVPCPASPSSSPHFPGCVNWILENQHKDGSWGLLHAKEKNRSLVKDALSSTLACALALKRWGIGDQHVHNALGFMARNSGCLRDSSQQNPIGFDIIFPAMVEAATENFNLNLPLQAADIDPMLCKRHDLLLTINSKGSISSSSSSSRSEGHNAYLAYISEGMGNSRRHWETALKFQRKNGSLFNSPSATAAAVIHRHDANSLDYLRSVVDLHTNPAGYNNNNIVAVPTSYQPHGVQTRLSLIDAIESLGIDHHFRDEIKQALDEIYRCWQHGEEEIFLDCTTCAMAFRMLRLNGYPVFPENRFWNDTMEGYLKDEKAVLELYKASRVILPEEPILERQQVWTRDFLVQLLGDQESSHYHHHHHNHHEYSNYYDHDHDHFNHRRPRPHKSVITEVHNVLRYPFRSDLEPLARKRTIEQYSPDTTRTLKTSFWSPNFGGQDFLKLASDDFTSLQLLHRQELGSLMLWLKEKKLDELRLAKPKMGYGYFHALAIFNDPEHSDARDLFSKHASLVGLIDDLFDIFGTREEHLNLIHLLERWDPVRPKVEFCSERVETLYWALQATICETAERAIPVHGRTTSYQIMDHVVELWLELLKGMLQETEWSTNTVADVPTLEQYIRNASITIALGPMFLPSLYFTGEDNLSEQVLRSTQFQKLLTDTSTCGRLLNDCRGFQREAAEGKMNAVSLRMSQGSRGSCADRTSVEEAIDEIESLIESLAREVLRMTVLEEEKGGEEIPRSVRNMFWKTVKSFHMFYMKEDLFNSSTKFVKVVHSFINDPIQIQSVSNKDC